MQWKIWKWRNIKIDIEDFNDSYVLDNIWGEDELNTYITKLEVLKKEHSRGRGKFQEKLSWFWNFKTGFNGKI